MPVGQASIPVESYSCTVVTSDPASGTVEVALPGNLENVIVTTTPVAFRWPMEGEVWRVERINRQFYLREPYPLRNPGAIDATTTTSTTTIETISPGDAVLNSPTGAIHVLGSKDGSTDFSFDKRIVSGSRGSGSFTGNSSSNILIPITHGLGSTPTFFTAIPQFEGIVKEISANSTIFTVQFDILTAAGAPGTNVTFASFGTSTWAYRWFACL